MEEENNALPKAVRRDHRSPLYKTMGAARTPLGAMAIVAVFMIPVLLLVLLVMVLI